MNSLREDVEDLTETVARALGFEHVIHPGHHTSAETPAAAVTIRTSTPGGPVSQLSDFLHAAAAKVERFDDAAIADFEALKATPEGAAIISIAGKIARNEAAAVLPGGITSNLLAALKGIESLAEPYITAAEQRAAQAAAEAAQQGEPSFTPAGPQVAGQA